MSIEIKTFADLNLAKQNLKLTIKEQESEILSNPVLSIPLSIIKGGSIKGSLQKSMESVSLYDYKQAFLSLISAVFMANKKTRKFFVAFIIAKEMVPFIIDKLNDFVKKERPVQGWTKAKYFLKSLQSLFFIVHSIRYFVIYDK